LLQGLAAQYGYPGVFAISLAGSAIPFIPLPYLAVVVLLSESKDPLLLGLIAGAGGAIGKLTSYVLGRLGYLAMGKSTQRNLDAIQGVMAKYGTLGVFVFAVTPLPDDVYVIPMGIARLSFWRFFAANLAGKIVLSVLVAYLGRAYLSTLSAFLGGESFPLLVLAVASTAAITFVMTRCDWALAVEVARAKGLRGLLSNMRQILRLGAVARKDREGSGTS
jgi:membrane protein YqaA with SNARE-associated domain